MPTAINKETGKRYPVTEEELKTLQENPLTSKLYDFKSPEVPAEVKQADQKTEQTKKGDNK